MDEVTIDALGAGGDGVAEDGSLFVPFSLPGERVAIDRRGQRGRPLRVLEASPDRAQPPCPNFGTCGGCALQHASDRLIAGWKRDLVARALAARGIESVELRPTLTSPANARRRITLSVRRTRKTLQIGFHGAGSDQIVPIETCAVARPELIEAIPRLTSLIAPGLSRKGEAKVSLTASEAGIDCAVTQAKPLDRPGLALLAGAASRAGLARLSWNGDIAVTLAAPWHQMGWARVVPPPAGFLQATAEGEAALVAAVIEAVGPAARVADLFAGSGTFALRLAEQAEVEAFEADAAALEALSDGWRKAESLKRITTARRELFHRPLVPRDLERYDAVVIDPPRAGARAQAEALAASAVPVIAYVSCNPATFARDARILIDGGYRIDWVQPIDQFRWSSHVELAARFSRG